MRRQVLCVFIVANLIGLIQNEACAKGDNVEKPTPAISDIPMPDSLIRAVKQRDFAAAKNLLSQPRVIGIWVQEETTKKTALMYAIQMYDPSRPDISQIQTLISAILAKTNNFNQQDCDGRTPLIHAILKGDTKTVKALAAKAKSDKKVDVNLPDNQKVTPLIHAMVYANNYDKDESGDGCAMITMLLDAGADANRAYGPSGFKTPLDQAALITKEWLRDTVRNLLVKHGAWKLSSTTAAQQQPTKQQKSTSKTGTRKVKA